MHFNQVTSSKETLMRIQVLALLVAITAIPAQADTILEAASATVHLNGLGPSDVYNGLSTNTLIPQNFSQAYSRMNPPISAIVSGGNLSLAPIRPLAAGSSLQAAIHFLPFTPRTRYWHMSLRSTARRARLWPSMSQAPEWPASRRLSLTAVPTALATLGCM